MNSRLFAPAIVVVSFGVTLGVTGWHAARTSAVSTPQPQVATVLPPRVAAVQSDAMAAAVPPRAPALVSPEEPVTTEAPDPQPVADTLSLSPEAEAHQSESFFDSRDRAAAHGARSH